MNSHGEQIANLAVEHTGNLICFTKKRIPDSAEDIVQEAFLRLCRQKYFPENPAAWLRSVIRNLIKDEFRRKKQQEKWESAVRDKKNPFEFSLQHIEQEAEIENLHRALLALDLECREILIAKIRDGLTFKEIAAKCGCSIPTIYRKYQQGLKILKEI